MANKIKDKYKKNNYLEKVEGEDSIRAYSGEVRGIRILQDRIEKALSDADSGHAQSRVLFVSNAFDEAGPGSCHRPFLSVTSALDYIIEEGDNSETVPYVIEVMPGIYNEDIKQLEKLLGKDLSFWT